MASKLKVDTIESVSTNGDITLDPDGTGGVVVASGHTLGVNTTPEAFNTVDGAAQVGTRQTLTSFSNDAGIGYNHYYNSGWKYTNADVARRFSSTSTIPFIWQYAASGSADAAITWSEAMRIDSSGNLLLGTTTNLDTASRLNVKYSYTNSGAAWESNSTATHNAIVFKNPNGLVGTIQTSGSSTAYNTSSDHRLKEAVVDMTGAIDRVKQLAPKRFNFIADPDDTTVDGFLAHEAQTVVPEAVTGTHNEVDDDGNAVMQGIDQSKLVPLLTGALQEAIAKIEALEARVTALENA